MSALPSQTWRSIAEPVRIEPAPRGLDQAWSRTVGALPRFRPRLRGYLARASQIERAIADGRIVTGPIDPPTLSRALHTDQAWVDGCLTRACLASRETIGLTPHRVQIAGAIALIDSCMIEMATGEGKTLVAALAACVVAQSRRGCHVITVNDYLAQRDARWMRPLFERMGLRVDAVASGLDDDARRGAYRADVTYTTSREAAADFLRDNLRTRGRTSGLASYLLGEHRREAPAFEPVQRGLEHAIVDEADSVLIDEAVTPLIIAAEGDHGASLESILRARLIAGNLQEAEHYVLDPRKRSVSLTRGGRAHIVGRRDEFPGDPTARRCEELVELALTAEHHFRRGDAYVVEEEAVVLIDESTGRATPDRRLRAGLHEAIEAKEGLPVRAPTESISQISFQRFFRSYRTIAGMSGTLKEVAPELWRVYHTPVVCMPTNAPCIRRRTPMHVSASQAHRDASLVEEVKRLTGEGRPVLIGTRSVDASRRLSNLLAREGIDHQVLNATEEANEAELIARAGAAGAVTVATNMAGRGTDIRLDERARSAGGLHVLSSELHASQRIDRQLEGRAGRQGDPGSTRAYFAPGDDLVRRWAPSVLQSLLAWWTSPWLARTVARLAQARASRFAARARMQVLGSDEDLALQLGFAPTEHT